MKTQNMKTQTRTKTPTVRYRPDAGIMTIWIFALTFSTAVNAAIYYCFTLLGH